MGMVDGPSGWKHTSENSERVDIESGFSSREDSTQLER